MTSKVVCISGRRLGWTTVGVYEFIRWTNSLLYSFELYQMTVCIAFSS